MLRVHVKGNPAPTTVEPGPDAALPAGTVWIDLLTPTREEELFVEKITGLGLPTREEMVEIEPSSRLYLEDGAIFLTANLLTGMAEGDPTSAAVSFVLTPAHLITIRYDAPKVFDVYSANLGRNPETCDTPVSALVGLLDAIVDRLADTIENIGGEMDKISRSTFRRATSKQQRLTNQALQVLLGRISHAQDALSKSRDSAVTLARLLSFLSFALKKDANGSREHLKSLARDVTSLTDHATYLGGNITFLLDAALGLINIEQNAIIKIFSVAAVIFMPPTLVASIYGMNFKLMPELSWTFGYPFAIVLMIAAAVLPYLFFKSRGWL